MSEEQLCPSMKMDLRQYYLPFVWYSCYGWFSFFLGWFRQMIIDGYFKRRRNLVTVIFADGHHHCFLAPLVRFD